jgi:hypothetical protein
MVAQDRWRELRQMNQVQLEALFESRFEERPKPGTDLIRAILMWECPGSSLLFLDFDPTPQSFAIPKVRLISKPT